MRNRSRMPNLIATEGHRRFGETKVGSELSRTFDFVSTSDEVSAMSACETTVLRHRSHFTLG